MTDYGDIYGEIFHREKLEEYLALAAINGSGIEALANHNIPSQWEVIDKEGKKYIISSNYILLKTTLEGAAKELKIDLKSIYNLTGSEVMRLRDYLPEWLYNKSRKKDLFRLMDDRQMDDVKEAVKIGLRRYITFNRFARQCTTERKLFLVDNMFELVGKVVIRNGFMQAAAKGSQGAVEQRLCPFLDLCDDDTISDADFRVLIKQKLLELKDHLHKELPALIKKELDHWATIFFRPYTEEERRKLTSGDEEESNDE